MSLVGLKLSLDFIVKKKKATETEREREKERQRERKRDREREREREREVIMAIVIIENMSSMPEEGWSYCYMVTIEISIAK